MADYDTTIATQTVTRRVGTKHLSRIDWDWPGFIAVSGGDGKHAGTVKRWLRLAEKAHAEGKKVHFSNYGGWPRLWREVYGFGMASHWPHWKPTPIYIVSSPLGGSEWMDYHTATNVMVDGEILP